MDCVPTFPTMLWQAMWGLFHPHKPRGGLLHSTRHYTSCIHRAKAGSADSKLIPPIGSGWVKLATGATFFPCNNIKWVSGHRVCCCWQNKTLHWWVISCPRYAWVASASTAALSEWRAGRREALCRATSWRWSDTLGERGMDEPPGCQRRWILAKGIHLRVETWCWLCQWGLSFCRT